MQLHFTTLGSGEPLLLLHGLLGSHQNLLPASRRFAEHFQVFAIDQRNHGHSPHQAEMNYYACAAAGAGHAFVPDALIDEGSGSYGPMHQFGVQFELTHFKHAVQKSGMPKYSGVWGYWSQMVSRDL